MRPRRKIHTFPALLAAFLLLLSGCSKTPAVLSSTAEPTTAAVTTASATVKTDAVDPEITVKQAEIGASVNAAEIPARDRRSNGIDVSKWQGKIDWTAVKKSGVSFAFIRIGYRGENGNIYKDENADYNLQQAEKAGILTGVYFFSTAINEKEALEEAAFTLSAIEGYSISYPVVYDCEGYTAPESRTYTISTQQRTQNAVVFLQKVKSAGYDTMFYGALHDIRDGTYWDMTAIGKTTAVWVAQYPATTYPQKDTPDYDGAFAAWQYTNQGTVSGINGPVDMVVCYFTKQKAAPKNKNATTNQAQVPPTEADKLYTAVNQTVTAKDVTNLREAASADSALVATLRNGETVKRTGIGTNGWSRLTYQGKTVYAVSSYLTTDLTPKTTVAKDVVNGQTFTPCDDRITAKDTVNLRQAPTTDSEVVASLKNGEFLQRTAIGDKGWSRLVYNGKDVYAVSQYLTDKVNQPTTTAPTSDGFQTVEQQVTAKSETNLRSAPSTTDSEVIYTLKNGEFVTRIGIHSNGWSKLVYNGQTVYAVSSYLTEK